MGAIKWIGGVLGWAMGGVMGGIIGFAVGSMFDNSFSGEGSGTQGGTQGRARGDYGGGYGQPRAGRPQTQPGDFGVSLLILSAAVMNSDKQVKKSELDYVKEFYKRQFGQAKAESYIMMLRELLQKEIDLREVCLQIKMYMDHASRLQLIHYLFGLSQSDGHVHPDEVQTVKNIANWLGISAIDYESIQAMFVKNSESAYKILEITAQATDEEVRKAYKRMAVKHHPDKVHHLGEDVQKAASEKFKEVNAAYEQIKKERGLN
jgi:DnaJ like chaperone protein